MHTNLTRALVLAGAVSLTNAPGSATTAEGELLVAPQGDPPFVIVAEASADFGFDLYRALARTDDGDLFFSPYSVATALAMAAEGARGRTAEEMAGVLRVSAAARRVGGDAQRVPFEWRQMHVGIRELARLFDTQQRQAQAEAVLAEVAGLEAELAGLQAEAAAARDAGDRDRLRDARTRASEVTREIVRLAPSAKTYELEIANSLWGERTYPFDPRYVETVESVFDTGAVVPADFASNAAREREAINSWVAKRTRDRITELIGPDDLGADTRLVLLNAIAFAGEWVTPFDAGRTEARPFTSADGDVVELPMMDARALETARYAAFDRDFEPFETPRRHGTDAPEYPDEDGFLMLGLPYRGGDLSMLVLLPMRAEGLAALEARLDFAKLSSCAAALVERPVHVELPKFRGESAFELADVLRALGMPSAFDRTRADFTGMSLATDPEDRLFIAKVLHKAFIEVDEAGTEAAAASAVIMRKRGGGRPFVPSFVANRPFIYLIRDDLSGSVLFLGRFTGD